MRRLVVVRAVRILSTNFKYLKELNETLYWLKLIDKSQINSSPELGILIQENKELCAIVARSVLTAKNRSRTKL
jgi:hypothetical protein